MTFLKSAAIALVALAAAPGQAETLVRAVGVEADLTALKNTAASDVWSNVEEDLEEAIVSRIVGKTSDKGSIVTVRMDTVSLANSIDQQLGAEKSELKGRVLIVHPDNRPNSVYNLTVMAASMRVPDDVVTLPIASEEYYRLMIEAFADNVVDKLK